MTILAEIKHVMQSDREKVNSICIYELEPNISRADCRARSCGRNSNRKSMRTYGTGAEAPVLGSVSSPAISSRRLSTSGKKSSESGASMMKKSVVARSAPKNLITLLPYRTQRGAVSEAYCPDLRCTLQAGMGKIVAAQRLELGGEREMIFWCVSLGGATSLL
jgi:hypothetical protein